MKRVIVVREYARITTDQVESSLHLAQVTQSAFDWLCNMHAGFNASGASLLYLESRRLLKLDSYVGVIETPCGTVLEILPKITETMDDMVVGTARRLLKKMLQSALDVPARTTDQTAIETFDYPLLEWVMKEFVRALDYLVKRGLQFDYRRIEEEQRFLRGQLDMQKQLRQPPGRAQIFNIRHDLFLPDRAENRLLKSAVLRIFNATKEPTTWRLARELINILSDVPSSLNIEQDFRQWRTHRLMAHYQPIRPWCELVLGQHMPLALHGYADGISLLFPMEKLFENYVAKALRRVLTAPFSVKAQAANQYLCQHEDKNIFQLRPDFLLQRDGENIAVLDTKWKLLAADNKMGKYNLSQNDFYQLFAYGHKYLGGKGRMALIYPARRNFCKPLNVFQYSNDLNLWVLPFDLERDELILPEEWSDLVMPLSRDNYRILLKK